MAAIMNGIARHGGFIPFGGTFLIFSDYMRNGIRMAALMRLRCIFVLTHDSIGLGEDGPTHQPIEQLASLRAVPNLDVWRPCDTLETAVAWRSAVERTDGPTAIVLSRQNLEQHPGEPKRAPVVARGAYVLADSDGTPALVLIATGSEVALAMQARTLLVQDGVATRVVSMPCTRVFDQQDAVYRQSVLPTGIRRVAIEAGIADYWRKYVGLEGAVVGIDTFGESAPAALLFAHFGFTAEEIARKSRGLIPRSG
jgi:transketolase